MSTKELCIARMNSMNEYQLKTILVFMDGMKAQEISHEMDEADDDAFCEELYQRYLNDPEKDDLMTEEDFLKELKITL